jgi:hypothetical protein
MPTPRKDVRNGFRDVTSAWEHLKKTGEDLICSQSLLKTESKRHTEVTNNRGKAAQSKYDRKYNLFLNKVDEAWCELCIVAFSRFQVDSTKKAILTGLATKTRERRGDIDPRIRSFFAELRKSEAVRAPQESSQGSTGTSELEQLERLNEAIASANPEAPAESWYEFTHAEPEGTIGMFGEPMAKRIKKVQDWRAVTMHFPKTLTPEFSCFLKLEIDKEYLGELAMALFKIKVSWGANTFQVVHENGMVQNMPEFTHKGALEEDIVAVFDPKIGSAITECAVRQRELAEAKSRTGCVSMIFAKGEGTLILALGLERGVQIQSKLYTKSNT